MITSLDLVVIFSFDKYFGTIANKVKRNLLEKKLMLKDKIMNETIFLR